MIRNSKALRDWLFGSQDQPPVAFDRASSSPTDTLSPELREASHGLANQAAALQQVARELHKGASSVQRASDLLENVVRDIRK